ncbi:MAG TPA: vWA domain-containing protein [Steroidobacteraceae bacterium]|nr:vWA domain-containing protein [Steroidobacteraceae bacterium]
MIEWSSLHFLRIWPLWLAAAAAVVLFAVWHRSRRSRVPDIGQVILTRGGSTLRDRLPMLLVAAILGLLTLTMMSPAVNRIDKVDQRARDFLILVDTSRSMRHDTQVRRDGFALTFERRAGAFGEAVEDPAKMPYVGRYELARESLLRFLAQRRAADRVALVYFNDHAFPVSALTTNIDFVVQQLAGMDDYVNGGTDIAGALASSLDLLKRYPDENKRTLILLSDAETAFTKDLDAQLTRLGGSHNLSFHMLWITTDADDQSNEQVADFLRVARSAGDVVTIQNPNSENLLDAFMNISRAESYSYTEVRREIVDLAAPAFDAARLAFFAWLVLVATIYHPGRMEFR